MENYEQEVKKFDALEKGETLNDPELMSIHQADHWVRSVRHDKLGVGFTNRVLASGIVAKRKKGRNRFFLILMGAFMVSLVLVLSILQIESSSSSSIELSPFLEQMDHFSEWIVNEKLRQLFPIIEAIILLLIIDQFLGRRSIYRSPTH